MHLVPGVDQQGGEEPGHVPVVLDHHDPRHLHLPITESMVLKRRGLPSCEDPIPADVVLGLTHPSRHHSISGRLLHTARVRLDDIRDDMSRLTSASSAGTITTGGS
ncbi:hypothetical protein GCM10009812_28560 [Nocardioides marinus]